MALEKQLAECRVLMLTKATLAEHLLFAKNLQQADLSGAHLTTALSPTSVSCRKTQRTLDLGEGSMELVRQVNYSRSIREIRQA